MKKLLFLLIFTPLFSKAQVFLDSSEVYRQCSIKYEGSYLKLDSITNDTIKPIKWDWKFQGGNPQTSNNRNTKSIIYDTVGEYITTLIVTWGDLTTDTLYYKIKVKPNPLDSISITINDTSICGKNSITIYPNSDVSRFSYTWFSPQHENPFTEDIPLVITQPGTHTLIVFGNCLRLEKTITVSGCGSTLYLPNAFSPNRDGLNDTYKVLVGYYDTFDLSIYNRWGEKIFESNDPNVGWDGTYMGNPPLTGVYLGILTVRYGNRVQTLNATIHLIK